MTDPFEVRVSADRFRHHIRRIRPHRMAEDPVRKRGRRHGGIVMIERVHVFITIGSPPIRFRVRVHHIDTTADGTRHTRPFQVSRGRP